ncbi:MULTISPECIES: hypothetical protein [Aequorivita]|uniref:hypothetical protein n=1 Tax=Aequorivita TaxID=153265 RepID=UPI001CE3831B|nr:MULTISPECIES: hypothetical protein [Aequorivita]UCA57244.1 hypothetical protein LDL78_05670 [Aequorivita sp. F7]
MASNSEVGHAKNVANFQDLIAFVEGYGPTTPQKPASPQSSSPPCTPRQTPASKT